MTDPRTDNEGGADPHGANATAARVGNLKARLARTRAARRRSALGLAEVAALAAAALLLLAALSSYFYLLLPNRARLQRAGAERGRLQNELRVSSQGVEEGEGTQASVERIVQSVDQFERDHLLPRDEAATALIEEINSLIRRNNLRISTGISFTQFDALTPGAPRRQQAQQQQQRAAGVGGPSQNVFPGVGVSLTVEGPYQNLRRFIRDVEADRRFVVINSVELEGVSDGGAAAAAASQQALTPAPPSATGAPAAPPARGTIVSLRLDLSAYFRRAPAVDALDASR